MCSSEVSNELPQTFQGVTSAAKVLCFALITVEAVSSSASPQTSPRANQDARIGI
jgi:hypothetical protein